MSCGLLLLLIESPMDSKGEATHPHGCQWRHKFAHVTGKLVRPLLGVARFRPHAAEWLSCLTLTMLLCASTVAKMSANLQWCPNFHKQRSQFAVGGRAPWCMIIAAFTSLTYSKGIVQAYSPAQSDMWRGEKQLHDGCWDAEATILCTVRIRIRPVHNTRWSVGRSPWQPDHRACSHVSTPTVRLGGKVRLDNPFKLLPADFPILSHPTQRSSITPDNQKQWIQCTSFCTR